MSFDSRELRCLRRLVAERGLFDMPLEERLEMPDLLTSSKLIFNLIWL